VNETQHNQNTCTHNLNTDVKVTQEGVAPIETRAVEDEPIAILAIEDDALLGQVRNVEEFVKLLAEHQTVPDCFYAKCNPAMWAVWCDIAWNSIELAAYSNGDRGVA